MPDNNNSFGLLDIINAALALWGAGKGSGSTPNFYTAPLTPGEQTEQTAKQNLFNYAGAYTDQFLRGTNNLNPTWSPSSPLLGPNGGGGFMGGIKVPEIDWSKMPPRPSTSGATGTTAAATPTAGATTNATDPAQGIPGPGGPDPFAGWPDPSPNAHNVTLDDLKKYGPQAFQIAEVLSGAGVPLASIVHYISSRFGGDQQLPTGHMDPNSLNLAPAGSGGGKVNFPPVTAPKPGDTRDVWVGGNLGEAGGPPPGWSLADPFSWYNKNYGGGYDIGFGNPNAGRYKP